MFVLSTLLWTCWRLSPPIMIPWYVLVLHLNVLHPNMKHQASLLSNVSQLSHSIQIDDLMGILRPSLYAITTNRRATLDFFCLFHELASSIYIVIHVIHVSYNIPCSLQYSLIHFENEQYYAFNAHNPPNICSWYACWACSLTSTKC